MSYSRNISNIKLEFFLYGLFILAPIIDALTGFLLYKKILTEGSLVSPSQFLRFSLFLLSLFLLNKNQRYMVSFIFISFFFIEILSYIRHQQLYVIIWGQLYVIKIITIYTFFCALYNYWRRYKLSILSLFIKSALIYSIILLITTVLGINIHTYGEGTFGSKGLFASGNGLGFYLGSTLCLYGYINNKYLNINKFVVLHQLILFASTLLVASKTSLIYIVIFFLIKFFHTNFSMKVIVLVSLSIIVTYYSDKIYDTFTKIYDVIVFRAERSDNFLPFIFSSRDNFVIDAFEKYYQTDYIIRFFTGGGSILSFQKSDNFIYDTLETDLFDIFFMYGIIFTLIYLFIIFYFLCKTLEQKKYIPFLLFLLMSVHSIMAGHIVFNAMSFIIVILLMPLVLDKTIYEKDNMFSPV